MRNKIMPLLHENQIVYKTYGPNAQNRASLHSEYIPIWEEKIQQTIIPNSLRIISLLEEHQELLLDEERNTLFKYKMHISILLNVAIQDAVGLPGVPGNAVDIVYVGNRIIEIYVKVIKWTLEFKSVSVPMEWKELIMSASAISETLINDLEEYIDFYNHGLSEGVQRLASGESGITLNLEFKLHEADLTEFNRKIEKIKQHYNL